MHTLEILYTLAMLSCGGLLTLAFFMVKKKKSTNKALAIYDHIRNVDNMEHYAERMVLDCKSLSLPEMLEHRGFTGTLSDVIFVPNLPTECSLKDLPENYRKVIDNAEHTAEDLPTTLDKLFDMFSEDPHVSGKRAIDSVVEMRKKYEEESSIEKKKYQDLVNKGGDVKDMRDDFEAFKDLVPGTMCGDFDIERTLKQFLYQKETMGNLERHLIPEHFKRILAPTVRAASREGLTGRDKKYLLLIAMKRLIMEVEAIQTTE